MADGTSGARRRVRIAHVCTIDLSLRYLLGNQMKYLQELGYDVIGISSPGPHVAWLEQRGIRHVAVSMTRAFTPAQDLRAVLDLARVMKRERLTIVHTHNAKPGLLGQLAARLAAVPIVVNTIHGFYFQDHTPILKRRFYVLMEQIAASCSSAILSQSVEDLETAVKENICRREAIEELGNGIDLARFDPEKHEHERDAVRASLGLSAEDRVVGFVGRLVEEKGIRELWNALRALRVRHPRIKLLIVGETDAHKRDAIRRDEAKDAGVDDICIFTGWRDDLPGLYAAMDVFALPSWREGFPRTPMEASAMKRPVIATNIRGCRETVIDGHTGRLVPVRDAAALAAALDDVLSSQERARSWGLAARKLAEERFDERRVFERVARTYQRLLGARA